jgi:protoporphyrinogen/coproporphyrinogen III oxidase
MSVPSKTVAVVGGGIAGLACTNRLLELCERNRLPWNVLLLERGARTGGVVSSEKRDGFLLEKGPDAFIFDKPATLELCARLGLEPSVIGTQPAHRKALVLHKGRLVALPEGFHLIAPSNIPAFLASPLFTPLGKARMLAERWLPRRVPEEDESIASFVRRRFGREALERVGQPMIAGVYSGDPEKLSLHSTMPRFREWEKTHGSVIRALGKRKKDAETRGARYSLFLSLKDGMQGLTDALAARAAGSLRLNFAVDSVSRDAASKKWNVRSEKGENVEADALCLAVSARQASLWLSGVSGALSRMLAEIEYESVATAYFAYEAREVGHPLDAFGFVVPRGQRRALMACTFAHRKFAGRAPEGKALLRAFAGGAYGSELLERSDADVMRTMEKDLKELLGIRGTPIFSTLTRHAASMPQYRVGHGPLLSRIEEAAAAIPGLFLTGSSYRGTGLSDCIRGAEDTAARILSTPL